MEKIDNLQRKAALIAKKMSKTISQSELIELETWLAEDKNNDTLFQKISHKNLEKDFESYQKIDSDKGFARLKKKQKRTSAIALHHWLSVAASVVFIIGLATYLLLNLDKGQSSKQQIEAGSSKAVLILSDGSVRDLEKMKQEKYLGINGTKLESDGKEIRYSQAKQPTTPNAKEEYNTLKIPVGGEYLLTLSDGTKIWLNSQTTLRYPVSFNGTERNVYLEGEAFFEVAPNKQRPFNVVTSHNVKVEVLGTSFNVRAYKDEEKIETVLEEGKVKMSKDSESVILEPGTLAAYKEESGEFSTQTVNIELFTAWRNGNYVFENTNINDILNTLSRWYGIEISYADSEVKSLVFSGSFKKYNKLENLLKAMEASGSIVFDITGNKIIVSSKKKNN